MPDNTSSRSFSLKFPFGGSEVAHTIFHSLSFMEYIVLFIEMFFQVSLASGAWQETRMVVGLN